ncbi:MAG TPA: hypothetical protein DCZ95_01465 [Verrucomicrobia bacterium]|nr:MAG: hypothetical protein A2X46_08815 [Lentisphaerae bacterium GWF2_57_35]HBA82737.1 hypothetical protein [Verrucomicrobiota bacterium]
MNIRDVTSRYESMLELVQCNLCGAAEYEIVYPPRYELARPDNLAETFRSSGDEILIDRLVRCSKCGLQYLNPRLPPGIVLEGYSEGKDETFVSQVAARERTFVKALKKIEKIVSAKGRILDVGTASGAFLGMAKQRGWDVMGCEPNRWMADWASRRYGITVVPGILSDMRLPADSFDVVTLWDVLEHTPDPQAVLADCHRILKPGGLLVVNYPDIHSSVARLMGRNWVFLLSVHLYYFTRATMQALLNKSGFCVDNIENYWQSLELGYILFRMQHYVGGLARLGERMVMGLKLEHANIPYWMGQVMVTAKKRAEVQS